MASNPRWKTGRRRVFQQRFKALGLPCGICGRDIDYSQPYYIIGEDGKKHINPLSWCIDEVIPVSKYQEGGFTSASAAADCFNNCQPAHVKCNAIKGNKTGFKLPLVKVEKPKNISIDGEW